MKVISLGRIQTPYTFSITTPESVSNIEKHISMGVCASKVETPPQPKQSNNQSSGGRQAAEVKITETGTVVSSSVLADQLKNIPLLGKLIIFFWKVFICFYSEFDCC
jgi:hypothetical protein